MIDALNTSSLFALTPEAALKGPAGVIMGAAAGVLVWWVLRVLWSEDLQQGAEWRYDVSRINQLRKMDEIYRVFYPVIGILARFNRTIFRDALPEINRQIQAAGLPRFWLAEEYLAKIELFALFMSPIYVYFFYGWLGAGGLLLAALAFIATGALLRRQLTRRAENRLKEIKRRMPFLLDLLTLLMEAGSTFINAMGQGVHEFQGHPVSQEFGRVLADMNLGKTRAEAFKAMQDRLADDEITSIIGSILQGEQLGTPLAQIFRTQADVLRLKRTQRAETVAGEAGVNMLLPGILIMAATVLIIIGPFVFGYLDFDLAM